jgi:hypothetical protein
MTFKEWSSNKHPETSLENVDAKHPLHIDSNGCLASNKKNDDRLVYPYAKRKNWLEARHWRERPGY